MNMSDLIVRATTVAAMVAMIATVHIFAMPISQGFAAKGWITIQPPVLIDVS